MSIGEQAANSSPIPDQLRRDILDMPYAALSDDEQLVLSQSNIHGNVLATADPDRPQRNAVDRVDEIDTIPCSGNDVTFPADLDPVLEVTDRVVQQSAVTQNTALGRNVERG